MAQNIYDIANELERSIRQLPEYKAVEAMKASLDSDKDAKELLESYLSFQHEVQEQLQAGQMPGLDLQERLEDFNKKIQGNPLLTEYFSKQQQLSVYIADLEKIIFKPLKELI
ncbi:MULTISPECIES: YlbF/YmcA family competence regulator [unclassified Streptococcus]|uniref:YlbF/YmcA family competence regulator n=1 Tax=unclassified Streptococcus TaxID=2608887 RepID=UPI00107211E5|nr:MULTISPECIES: YlbF/YmcA family competence regulator [unclassified Streptococcus]MBF0786892.1 YlbF/YmcA family competence regulator [Streptococcus sp. 19428wC2_LYSM12]MCQ9212696.1 YlbF/YmcA family competence regulator [Streptococcus sp. B01]MCQ9214037.1 YlbF/YmcA family competence regulator [Streptococcus sp. O1]TFV06260.1 YlbF/YmcA family competence regulator [Streptococcus sp. LYSM12]